MANIIMITGEHDNQDAAGHLIEYIYDSPYFREGNSYMTFSYNIAAVTNSFELVQKHYNVISGRRVQHIIIGFKDGEVTLNGLSFIAQQAAWFIGQRFQCCYGIRCGSENHSGYDHIHLAVNVISYVDGKKYYERWDNLWALANYLNQVTKGEFDWNVYMKESNPYTEERLGGGTVFREEELIKAERL